MCCRRLSALGPCFAKTIPMRRCFIFKEFWILRGAESYVKTRTNALQMVPFNCLIASAQRRLEPLRAILFFFYRPIF